MKNINLFYDQEFRQKLRANPKHSIAELGIQTTDNIELMVVTSTKETMYFSMPNHTIETADLSNINAAAAGGTAGTAGSASTLSTLSCPADSFSSLSTTGTAGTVK